MTGLKKGYFSNPRTDCVHEGVIAVSFDIDSDLLIEAYSKGIFPWPYEEDEVLWFCPPKRGVLYFKDLKASKSLLKAQKKEEFNFTINQAFDQVIEECAKASRSDNEGTWITKKILKAYKSFYKKGHILCVECWQGGVLVGGIYGVYLKGVFSAESMFYKKPNASKLAFLFLITELKKQGLTWMDTQMVTPVTEKFGAINISRDEYLDLLSKSQS